MYLDKFTHCLMLKHDLFFVLFTCFNAEVNMYCGYGPIIPRFAALGFCVNGRNN